jgi:hypothetical protein
MGYVKLSAPPTIGNVTQNTGQFSTVGVGAAAVTSALYVNASNRIGAWVTGTNISTGADADGIFVDASFAPSANVGNAASIGLYPTFNPGGGVTITTGYGLYVAAGTQGGAGAVTTGYGLFVTHPAFGTTNYAAQIDNLRVDLNSITATNANGSVSVLSDGSGAANFGTNATAHTSTLGSTTTTATTAVQSGSGGITVATSSNGTIGVTSGTGTISVSADAAATTVNLATGAAVKTTTLGSTNSTSTTTVQSGSGALAVTSTNGTLTINSGTGALSISSDASATTVNIATGGAVKTTTLGSTNSTSTTTIACGTGGANFGTSANAHATTIGSTTASATTVIQGPAGGVSMTGVAGTSVANLNVVTINTSTGQLGSQALPAGAVSWSVITADQTAVVNNGYICNKGSALLLTLPATAAVGDTIKVTGINTALGWKVVQNANQQIFFGNTSTTLGATGFLQSAATRDSAELLCVVAGASTVYNVISSIGNITIS